MKVQLPVDEDEQDGVITQETKGGSITKGKEGGTIIKLNLDSFEGGVGYSSFSMSGLSSNLGQSSPPSWVIAVQTELGPVNCDFAKCSSETP